jgi:hypothetical protein
VGATWAERMVAKWSRPGFRARLWRVQHGGSEVAAILREAHAEPGHRNCSYDLPAAALLGKGKR